MHYQPLDQLITIRSRPLLAVCAMNNGPDFMLPMLGGLVILHHLAY